MTLSYEEYCSMEKNGVRCTLGPGHFGKCLFRPLELSDAQEFMLLRAASGSAEYNWATAPEYSTAKSLKARALVSIQFGASRYFRIFLTAAGKRVLADLPK